jgi:hypothetical protein
MLPTEVSMSLRLYLPFLVPKMQVFMDSGILPKDGSRSGNTRQSLQKTLKTQQHRSSDIFQSWFPCVRKSPQTNRKQTNPALV